MGRAYSNRKRPMPSCKRHPGIPAVKNGLCVSCAKYDDLQKKITAKDAPKPKAPAGAPK